MMNFVPKFPQSKFFPKLPAIPQKTKQKKNLSTLQKNYTTIALQQLEKKKKTMRQTVSARTSPNRNLSEDRLKIIGLQETAAAQEMISEESNRKKTRKTKNSTSQ